METKINKSKFELWEVITISFISSLIMSVCTGYFVFKGTKNDPGIVQSDNKHIAEFTETYNNLVDNYYSSIDEGALIDAAIQGMLGYLGDPYTTYLDKSNTDELTESLSGTYKGMGVLISKNDKGQILVNEVYENTPAYNSGIKANDIIKKINDTELENKETQDAVDLIRNAKDVTLIVVREGKEIEIQIKPEDLEVPTASSEIFEKDNHKIGYLSLSKFNENCSIQFKNKLTKLEADGIESLIIDLRDNTGGYLNEATSIAEMFLKKGKIIYSLNEQTSSTSTIDQTNESRNYKIFILTNGNTASASEVLIGALVDSYGAKVVGTQTFGKGKVQKTSTLSDGTMYKYTSAKWLTPSGECIDGIGISPDYLVEPTITDTSDIILEKAIEEIIK